MTTPNRLLFLDFEASSLDQDSWPIEWGISWIDKSGIIKSEGGLIAPHASWAQSAWSEKSESVHGITRAMLDEDGESVDIAAERLCAIATSVLISDAPPFDGHWLKRLLDAAGLPMLPIASMHQVFKDNLGPKGQDTAYEYLRKTHVPHRAKEDSAIMAQAWKRGVDTDAGSHPYGP